jgi:alpha-amylase
MGVAYHAHARFLDHQGRRITVPAPVDPQTPAALWWYDWIATNAATLRRAGFTAVLYPPVCKTQSGHFNTGDGYGVYDQYDIGSKNQMGSIETRFGSREQLQRSIAAAHACGLDVYVDVVLHQLNGGDNGVHRYLGANGVTSIGRFPKNPGCFRGAPPRRPEDPVPVPADGFPFWRRAGLCQLRATRLHDRWDDRFRRLANALARLPGLPGRRHEGDGGRFCKAVDEYEGDDRPVLRQRMFRW